MPSPNFVLLYVDSPRGQRHILRRPARERQPVETSPTFVMFALENGVMLGLWSRHTVQPAARRCRRRRDSPSRSTRLPLSTRPSPTGRSAASPSCSSRPTWISAAPSSGSTRTGHRLRVFAPSGQ